MIPVYQNSGRFNPVCIAYALACTVMAGALGFVYQVLVSWIPLIYLNFLLSIGLGMAIAVAGEMSVRLGKCRSTLLACLLGAVLCLAAVGGSHYQGYREMDAAVREAASVVDDESAEEEQASPAPASHLTISAYLALRTQIGWTIGRAGSSSSSGPTISGAGVYIVWLIEAAIIFFIGIAGAAAKARAPFCERCDMWADAARVVRRHSVNSEEAAAKLKAAATPDELVEELPQKVNPGLPAELVYTLTNCPGCGQFAHLTIEQIVTQKDSKGKEEQKKSELFENVSIGASLIPKLERPIAPALPEEPAAEAAGEEGRGEHTAV